MQNNDQITGNLYHSSTLLVSGSLMSDRALADRFSRLHDLLTDHFDSYQHHRESYLKAGLQMFNADEAMLLRLRFLQGDAVFDAYHGELFEGVDAISQAEGWINFALVEKSAGFLSNEAGNSSLMTYNGKPVRGSLCAPIFISDQMYGLLCFLQTREVGSTYSASDKETIELMAKGVAKMIELQKNNPESKSGFRRGFATEGVKTFEEYVQQARLPEVYGVPGRVVEVLERRIGSSPLSIDYIAEEMNLSKRTLQRRLQQQEISFAQLRDQVRFHHSINYLIENTMSIDSISAALDFSDRTSFTNAFKRWTGLSPSIFRKLFRDYA